MLGAGGLQQGSSDRGRYLDGHEAVRREQIILAALVDDSKVAVAFCVRIRQNRIDLVALERRLVPVVADADRKPAFGESLPDLVEVALALELFLADAMRFIPVYFRQSNPAIAQPYTGVAFEFPPVALPTQSSEAGQGADAAACGDRLDVGDIARGDRRRCLPKSPIG